MVLEGRSTGTKGREIAEYFWRDPASITGHVGERTAFETDIEKGNDMLRKKRTEFNT